MRCGVSGFLTWSLPPHVIPDRREALGDDEPEPQLQICPLPELHEEVQERHDTRFSKWLETATGRLRGVN